MKKKVFNFLSLFSLALLMSIGMVYAQQNALNIHKTNEVSIESSLLENIRHLSFVENQLLVTFNNGESSIHELDEVTKLIFGEALPTEMITPTAINLDAVVYINQAGEIVVESPATIQSLTLFNIDGKVLLRTVETQCIASLPISALPTGVYLLQVATKQGMVVKKIVKK